MLHNNLYICHKLCTIYTNIVFKKSENTVHKNIVKNKIKYYLKCLSITIVTIIASGTARKIPITPNTLAHNTIHKKITRGLTHNDLFIRVGIKILFSVH